MVMKRQHKQLASDNTMQIQKAYRLYYYYNDKDKWMQIPPRLRLITQCFLLNTWLSLGTVCVDCCYHDYVLMLLHVLC